MQVFGVAYALTFDAFKSVATVKVILALAATWGVPAKNEDVSNAYANHRRKSIWIA